MVKSAFCMATVSVISNSNRDEFIDERSLRSLPARDVHASTERLSRR